MAGLLDYQMPAQTAMDDPRTAGLLRFATGLLQGAGPSARPVGLGQLIGGAGNEGMAAYNQAQDAQVKNLQQQMAMQEALRKQQELALRQAAVAKLPPEIQQAIAAGVPYNDIWKKQNPEAKLHDTYTPDGQKVPSIVDMSSGTVKPIGAPAPMEAPKVQNFINGDQETQKVWNPKTMAWDAVGTGGRWNPKPLVQMTNKVDVKTGESLAGQVGGMLKDSKVQANGAVQMFDAASRIENALDSNKVSAGPGTSKVLTVRQFVQSVAGGNDERIRQTRQVIKSLAQMSVEARKQLQGQGQVTESEAAAVAKADSGDIDSLTTGELRDLVTLTKRASHFTAKAHQDQLNEVARRPETANLVPFYKVRGLDTVLQHSPQLPNIGGQTNVLDAADKILGK